MNADHRDTTTTLPVKIRDAIQRELKRWDGIEGLPRLAYLVAPAITKRVLATLSRNGVPLS